MNQTEDQNPGAAFKASRERLGLSINDVAVATKINPRILKALEDGDRTALPAHSFARGFIRSYANYLKIDSAPILESYNLNGDASSSVVQADSPSSAEPATPDLPKKERAEKKVKISAFREASTASKMLLTGGILLAVVLVFGIKKVVDKYAQERIVDNTLISEEAPLTDAAPPSNGLVLPPSSEVAAAPEAKTEPEIKAADPSQAADDHSAAKVADSAPTPTHEVKKEDAPVSPTTIPTASPNTVTPNATAAKPAPANAAATASAPAASPTTPTPEPPKTAAKPETKPAEVKSAAAAASPQEVILEALDSVEVTAVIDGVSQKLKLSPEGVHTIKAKATILLEIEDGGMVNIIHNGRDRGVPGDLGKPAKVKFP